MLLDRFWGVSELALIKDSNDEKKHWHADFTFPYDHTPVIR